MAEKGPKRNRLGIRLRKKRKQLEKEFRRKKNKRFMPREMMRLKLRRTLR